MNRTFLFAIPVLLLFVAWTAADDWPMGGRSRDRNPVSPEKNAPIDWHVGDKESPQRNIRWVAKLPGFAFGGPVVANGLIWVGASNIEPIDPAIPDDRAVLACYRESDGTFLYQYTSPRLEKYTQDWSRNGLSGSPLVEGDRLWFITNRREVVCLDVGPLRRGDGLPTELWKYDLIAKQGVIPDSPMLHGHNTLGSLATHGELLFVPTGNGVAVDYPGANKVKAPKAPSLVCLRKDSGELVWKDSSAGDKGYGGHHVSPLVVEAGAKTQVIHPQADGWIRSYDVATGELLWRFDINHKDAIWDWTNDERNRHTVAATPVFAEGRVFVAAGRNVEFSDRYGRLFCIDPTKSGDISPELDDGEGSGKVNPNSGLVWDFEKEGAEDSQIMHQTLSSVAVSEGLVVAMDQRCFVHCFDSKTGKRNWCHNVGDNQSFGDPLVVDGKIYVTSDTHEVTILTLSKDLEVIAKHEMDDWCIAPPVFANGTLYIQTQSKLYAIGSK
jgi:outer membrane protein assembly factor BamB